MKEARLDPKDDTVRTAVLGQQVQDFLATPVGDLLIKRAELRLALLIQQLKTIDPAKTLEIAKLQIEISHLEQFEGWLGNAVQEGLTAVAIIDGEDIDA